MSRWDLCQICVIKRAGNGIFEVENVKECNFFQLWHTKEIYAFSIILILDPILAASFLLKAHCFFSSDPVFGDWTWQEPQCCPG